MSTFPLLMVAFVDAGAVTMAKLTKMAAAAGRAHWLATLLLAFLMMVLIVVQSNFDMKLEGLMIT